MSAPTSQSSVDSASGGAAGFQQCPACRTPASQTAILQPPCGHAFCAQCPSVDHTTCNECRLWFGKSLGIFNTDMPVTSSNAQAECGLCHQVCAKMSVRLGCGHCFCSLCLKHSDSDACAVCGTQIVQSQSTPFQGTSHDLRVVLNGDEVMSIAKGVFPAKVLGLAKYRQLSSHSSSALSFPHPIVSLADLLEVEASSDPNDWDVSAEPSLVDMLAGLDSSPLQFASAPKQLAQLTEVAEHYRRQLSVKLSSLQQDISPDNKQRERKETGDVLERLIPDPPVEYQGRCAVRVHVSVLGGAMKTEHVLGDHKDPARVRVGMTVGVRGRAQFVQHARVLDADSGTDDTSDADATKRSALIQVELSRGPACDSPGHCGSAVVGLTLRPRVAYRSLAGQLVVPSQELGGVFAERTDATSPSPSSSSPPSSSSVSSVGFTLVDSGVVCEHLLGSSACAYEFGLGPGSMLGTSDWQIMSTADFTDPDLQKEIVSYYLAEKGDAKQQGFKLLQPFTPSNVMVTQDGYIQMQGAYVSWGQLGSRFNLPLSGDYVMFNNYSTNAAWPLDADGLTVLLNTTTTASQGNYATGSVPVAYKRKRK